MDEILVLRERLATQPWVERVGMFAADGPVDRLPAELARGDCDALLAQAAELALDEVILVPGREVGGTQTEPLLRALQLLPVNLHIGPWDLLQRYPAAERVDIAGLALINVSRQPLRGTSRVYKWLEDFVLATACLPLMLWIVLAIAAGDDPAASQAFADDARCTRVGRLLRRFSLDELPQLFNVLGGTHVAGRAAASCLAA